VKDPDNVSTYIADAGYLTEITSLIQHYGPSIFNPARDTTMLEHLVSAIKPQT
jgi:hypothetical protein